MSKNIMLRHPAELLNPDVQLHVSWAEGGLDDISGL